MPTHIVIVGAGEAGTRAALALREKGFDGNITLIGAESNLPYERPPLSKAVLTEGVQPPMLTHPAELQEKQITLQTGQMVSRLERSEQRLWLQDGTTTPYDALILATGARARRLGTPGGEWAQTLRQLPEALAVRAQLESGRRVLLIGAGFIGLEIAASASQQGCQVTVLEQTSQVLSRIVPHEIADQIAQRHQAAGVNLVCGVQLQQLIPQETSVLVEAQDGRSWEAELVLAGIGAIPETELAESAGLAVENGIRVDEYLRTSDPHIYAIGDCCSFPHPLYGNRRLRLEMWRSAREQGECVASTLSGTPTVFRSVPWFWSDQFELGLQVAGLPGTGIQSVQRSRADGVVLHFELGTQGQLLSAAAVGPGNSVAKDLRLAERMIAERHCPSPEQLADPACSLKQLLKEGSIAQGS